MTTLTAAIQAAADADHARQPGCAYCGRRGEAYEHKGVRFDGLTSYRGERLCPACSQARMDADGVNIRVDPGHYRLPYVVNTRDLADQVTITCEFGDGRDMARKHRGKRPC